MDYRSDVLVAWEQNGAVYAHMLRASGRPEPTQLVGASGSNPQLQALVSDNDHGMIAWSSTETGQAGARTRVVLALSRAAVRFGRTRAVASFADPRAVGSSPGALALVRLSTENVMLAWTEADQGHYVVRAIQAVFAGAKPATLLSDPSGQSVLAGLAPGPAGEAVALWRGARALGTSAAAGATELWAARTYMKRGGRVGSHAAELIVSAAAGATTDPAPSIAVDPATDRAVAAWLTPGPRPRLEYATGPPAPGYRSRSPGGAAMAPAGGTHWLRIALAAAAVTAFAALIALALARRAGARRAGGASRRRSRRR
jgi:hypothetical protein